MKKKLFLHVFIIAIALSVKTQPCYGQEGSHLLFTFPLTVGAYLAGNYFSSKYIKRYMDNATGIESSFFRIYTAGLVGTVLGAYFVSDNAYSAAAIGMLLGNIGGYLASSRDDFTMETGTLSFGYGSNKMSAGFKIIFRGFGWGVYKGSFGDHADLASNPDYGILDDEPQIYMLDYTKFVYKKLFLNPGLVFYKTETQVNPDSVKIVKANNLGVKTGVGILILKKIYAEFSIGYNIYTNNPKKRFLNNLDNEKAFGHRLLGAWIFSYNI